MKAKVRKRYKDKYGRIVYKNKTSPKVYGIWNGVGPNNYMAIYCTRSIRYIFTNELQTKLDLFTADLTPLYEEIIKTRDIEKWSAYRDEAHKRTSIMVKEVEKEYKKQEIEFIKEMFKNNDGIFNEQELIFVLDMNNVKLIKINDLYYLNKELFGINVKEENALSLQDIINLVNKCYKNINFA